MNFMEGHKGIMSVELLVTKETTLIVDIPSTLTLINNPDIYQDVPKEGNSSMVSGNMGIGTTNPGSYKLAVKGKIRAEEIKVETGWADYIFEEGYDLPTLEEVENHIKEKGHLINIPSAKEVEENGVQLGEMNKLLLEKIEELTLYTIEQQKEISLLKKEIQNLKNHKE